MKITATPIGTVKRNNQNVKDKQAISKIIINKNLTDALQGLEDYSHLFIIFWMHKVTEQDRNKQTTHPWGRTDLPQVGVYATRTRTRKNPIGLTLVKLVEKNQNTLHVQGLDALDETPVLDIKPYDKWDKNLEATVPEWWHEK